MPVLANAQHEAFVQSLARKGTTQRQALIDAGYSETDTSDSRGSQIWARAEVKARYAEIRKEMQAENAAQRIDDAQTSPSMVTKNWMIDEYKKNIAAAREAGKPGDANRALDAIGRLLGFFDDPTPPQEPTKPGTVPGTTAPVQPSTLRC
jgi:hypothetical protein